jgi:uncharacterized repeat protein (TIGR02543 family)
MKKTAASTLYARWSINSCTATFDKNGSSSAPSKATIKKNYNTAIGTLPTIKRTGYTFKGWYTKTSGGTKITTTTKLTKNITYYAQWTANKYKVTYNANGGKIGTATTASKTIAYGSKYTLPATPKKSGYTFAGWFTSKTGGTQVLASTVMKKTAASTLYARWTKNKIKILYIPIADVGPMFKMARYSFLEMSKTNPNLTIDIKSGDYNPPKQNALIEEAIEQGYDGIFAEVMDPSSSKIPIEKAEAAGIPVITINLNSNAIHTLHIQGDDYAGGEQAADVLGKAAGGTGNYLTLNGPAAQKDNNQSIKGFVSAMDELYPSMDNLEDIPTAYWDKDEAKSNMADALDRYPEIDVVYAASDDIATGAIGAITEAGRQDEIKVYCGYGYPTSLQRTRTGSQFGTSAIDMYVEYQTAVNKMIEAITNGKSAKDLDLKSTPLLNLPLAQITKDGVYGSTDVETYITESYWDIVQPSSFEN